jgi:hypothetical protein
MDQKISQPITGFLRETHRGQPNGKNARGGNGLIAKPPA